VRWNVDKHYLRDLAERGLNVPVTRFIERGETTSLREAFAACHWNEVILKPAVSGAARHTYRLNAANLDAHKTVLQELLREESMIIQPFLTSVLTQGELSLIVIGGRCTHAVRKIAKPGDFRVQDDHGGTVHPHTPTADEIAFAESAVAACPQSPLYARVDAVRDASGELSLMELELVEPELFFRFHPPAADALAAAIAARL
jgi:glutathione synthase/RimK-type ligase-like ATP-grasp enzyme